MLTDRYDISALSYDVIGAAVEVHRIFGPGLLERPCCLALVEELKFRGIRVATELAVPVSYKGKALGCGYRIDVLVEDTIIVEVKSVAHVADVHKKQLLCYLKLTDKPLGLLINFNMALLKDGVTRIINDGPKKSAAGGEGTEQPS